MFVLRESPYCVDCARLGESREAVEVDHIVPVAMGGTDEWENLQPLCAAHHRLKSGRDAAALRAYLARAR
jgi:5-methylcytosine-specific restriction enzyme A